MKFGSILNILNILLFDFCHDVVFKTILEKKLFFYSNIGSNFRSIQNRTPLEKVFFLLNWTKITSKRNVADKWMKHILQICNFFAINRLCLLMTDVNRDVLKSQEWKNDLSKKIVLRLFYLVYQFDFVFVKCLFLIKADVLRSSGGVLKRRLWKTSLFLTKLFFLSIYLFTLVASFLFYSLGERWQTLRNHKYAEWLYWFREAIHDWLNARHLHSIIWLFYLLVTGDHFL